MWGETKTWYHCQDIKKKFPPCFLRIQTGVTDLGNEATIHFKIEKIELRVKEKDLLKRNPS